MYEFYTQHILIQIFEYSSLKVGTEKEMYVPHITRIVISKYDRETIRNSGVAGHGGENGRGQRTLGRDFKIKQPSNHMSNPTTFLYHW